MKPSTLLLTLLVSIFAAWERGEGASQNNNNKQEVVYKAPRDFRREYNEKCQDVAPRVTHLVWMQFNLEFKNLSALVVGVYGETSLHAASWFMKLAASRSGGYADRSRVSLVENGSFTVSSENTIQKQNFSSDNSSFYRDKFQYAPGLVFMDNTAASSDFTVAMMGDRANVLAKNIHLIIIGRVVGGAKMAEKISLVQSTRDGIPVKPINVIATGVFEVLRPFQVPFTSNGRK